MLITFSTIEQYKKEMKSGASSLNPNAASYVPLSKRVVDIKSDTVGGAAKTTEGSMNSAQGHDGRKAWVGSNDHELQCFPGAGNFSLQSYHSQGSSSQHLASLADKLIPEEVYDIHLEYLQMTFPGLSHQSLAEVYLANNGDIDASIDMLNDLEVNAAKSISLDAYLSFIRICKLSQFLFPNCNIL